MIPTLQIGGIGIQKRPAAATGTGLFDLIMADITSAGGGIYLRLNETSGTVADDQASTTNGTYNGVVLNNSAIYPGGPVCMRTDSSGDYCSFPGESVPTLNSMTLGLVVKPAAISGLRFLISRDSDSGGRYWQWRMNGNNFDFIKLVTSTQTVSVAHGMSAGTAYLVMATISSGGSVKLFRNGTKLTTGSISAANYGGSAARKVMVGNRESASEATDNYYSEAFVIATELSESRVADYATASGL